MVSYNLDVTIKKLKNIAQKSVTYVLLIMCDSHTDEKGNVTHMLLVMMAEDEIAEQTKGSITYYMLLIM